MSEILEQFRQDEQRVLDRLADGELLDFEVRALLGALDRETDGWRRCALAFIESQTLCGELRGLQSETIRPVPNPALAAPLPRRSFWPVGLALAASVLVAFSLGLWAGGDSGVFRGFANPAGKPTQMVYNKSNRSATDTFANDPAGGATAANDTVDDGWRTVTLNFSDSLEGESRDIELPVRDMASIDPNWGANDQSALSADVVRALEQSGHIVKREQSLWPIQLQDGRRLFVPVEQVEVQNVEYQ